MVISALIFLLYRYRLGDAETPEGSSEEELDDEDLEPAKKAPVKKSKLKG